MAVAAGLRAGRSRGIREVEPQGYHGAPQAWPDSVRVRDQIFDGLAGCPTRPLDAARTHQVFLVIGAPDAEIADRLDRSA